MYRRRRPQRNQIAFSFDSFLDVVTNVIGIIIRLILVTGVGASAYTAAMMNTVTAPQDNEAQVSLAPLPGPKAEDDPMSKELLQTQLELKKLRNEQTRQLKELHLAQNDEKEINRALKLADDARQDLDRKKRDVDDLVEKSSKDVQNLAMTKEELLQMAKKLREQMQAVAKLPTPTKQLRYRTPVSRPVRTEEFHFECQRGRVAFIDLVAFVNEINDNFKEASKSLETKWEVEALTSQIGDFRLRYVIDRERESVDRFVSRSAPTRKQNFGKSLAAWKVEPVVDNRGETIETALDPRSAFRQIITRIDPEVGVVTLWVYPDSFGMFRQLRDFLHEQNIEVAAWPIPLGATIAASRHGTASRGQ